MFFFKRIKNRLTSPEANVSLKFNKNSYVAGENLEGTLTVNSNEEFDALEIRCEIECVEQAKKTRRDVGGSVARGEISYHQTEYWESSTLFSEKPSLSGSIHLSKGFTKDFPFSINIPVSGPASCKDSDRRVTWSIKGVVAIDGRPDVTSRTMEIQVAPPSATPIVREREVIREVVMIPCKYCGGLMSQTETACPHCGAKRTV